MLIGEVFGIEVFGQMPFNIGKNGADVLQLAYRRKFYVFFARGYHNAVAPPFG